MSSSSTTFRGVPVGVGIDPFRYVARRVFTGVVMPIQFVAFWTAIVLPVLYVPLLLDGLTPSEAGQFAVLLCVHLLALIVGHGYKRRS